MLSNANINANATSNAKQSSEKQAKEEPKQLKRDKNEANKYLDRDWYKYKKNSSLA